MSQQRPRNRTKGKQNRHARFEDYRLFSDDENESLHWSSPTECLLPSSDLNIRPPSKTAPCSRVSSPFGIRPSQDQAPTQLQDRHMSDFSYWTDVNDQPSAMRAIQGIRASRRHAKNVLDNRNDLCLSRSQSRSQSSFTSEHERQKPSDPSTRSSILLIDEDCVVCMKSIESPRGYLSVCDHTFCAHCITSWMHSNAENGSSTALCPMCRAVIHAVEIGRHQKGRKDQYLNTQQWFQLAEDHQRVLGKIDKKNIFVVAEPDKNQKHGEDDSFQEDLFSDLTACTTCALTDTKTKILCDACDNGFHLPCVGLYDPDENGHRLGLTLQDCIPSGMWYCQQCWGSDDGATLLERRISLLRNASSMDITSFKRRWKHDLEEYLQLKESALQLSGASNLDHDSSTRASNLLDPEPSDCPSRLRQSIASSQISSMQRQELREDRGSDGGSVHVSTIRRSHDPAPHNSTVPWYDMDLFSSDDHEIGWENGDGEERDDYQGQCDDHLHHRLTNRPIEYHNGIESAHLSMTRTGGDHASTDDNVTYSQANTNETRAISSYLLTPRTQPSHLHLLRPLHTNDFGGVNGDDQTREEARLQRKRRHEIGKIGAEEEDMFNHLGREPKAKKRHVQTERREAFAQMSGWMQSTGSLLTSIEHCRNLSITKSSTTTWRSRSQR